MRTTYRVSSVYWVTVKCTCALGVELSEGKKKKRNNKIELFCCFFFYIYMYYDICVPVFIVILLYTELPKF